MKRRLLAILLSAITLATAALPAYADGPNTPPGYKQPTRQLTGQEAARNKQKATEADALFRMFNSYREGKAGYAALEKVVQVFNDHWAKGKPAKETIERLGQADPNLGLNLVAQETGYWCGPASAYMGLAYKGAWTDPRNPSRSLSQSNLATDLGTSQDGTIWANVPGVLNAWANTNWYANFSAPTSTQVMNDASLDYANSYPWIYDTHMSSSTGYLTGWSSGDIWHYVAGDGYDNNSQQVHYYDPYSSNPNAYGNWWIPASTMSGVLQDRGMTW